MMCDVSAMHAYVRGYAVCAKRAQREREEAKTTSRPYRVVRLVCWQRYRACVLPCVLFPSPPFRVSIACWQLCQRTEPP